MRSLERWTKESEGRAQGALQSMQLIIRENEEGH